VQNRYDPSAPASDTSRRWDPRWTVLEGRLDAIAHLHSYAIAPVNEPEAAVERFKSPSRATLVTKDGAPVELDLRRCAALYNGVAIAQRGTRQAVAERLLQTGTGVDREVLPRGQLRLEGQYVRRFDRVAVLGEVTDLSGGTYRGRPRPAALRVVAVARQPGGAAALEAHHPGIERPRVRSPSAARAPEVTGRWPASPPQVGTPWRSLAVTMLLLLVTVLGILVRTA
jgi:hypothetical protein